MVVREVVQTTSEQLSILRSKWMGKQRRIEIRFRAMAHGASDVRDPGSEPSRALVRKMSCEPLGGGSALWPWVIRVSILTIILPAQVWIVERNAPSSGIRSFAES